MKIINRSECAILHLVLKRKWYDLIASGVKREEYRAATQYWQKRIENWNLSNKSDHIIEFRRGYRKDAPRMAFSAMAITIDRLRWFGMRKSDDHPEWGEPRGLHYVLVPGSRVEFADLKGARSEKT